MVDRGKKTATIVDALTCTNKLVFPISIRRARHPINRVDWVIFGTICLEMIGIDLPIVSKLFPSTLHVADME